LDVRPSRLVYRESSTVKEMRILLTVERDGDPFCRDLGPRVRIAGGAVKFLEGHTDL
jgi:hypothetical protein